MTTLRGSPPSVNIGSVTSHHVPPPSAPSHRTKTEIWIWPKPRKFDTLPVPHNISFLAQETTKNSQAVLFSGFEPNHLSSVIMYAANCHSFHSLTKRIFEVTDQRNSLFSQAGRRTVRESFVVIPNILIPALKISSHVGWMLKILGVLSKNQGHSMKPKPLQILYTWSNFKFTFVELGFTFMRLWIRAFSEFVLRKLNEKLLWPRQRGGGANDEELLVAGEEGGVLMTFNI